MQNPLLAARSSDGASLWVFNLEKPNATAVIVEAGERPDEARASPLQSLLAHIDLDEWDFVDDMK